MNLDNIIRSLKEHKEEVEDLRARKVAVTDELTFYKHSSLFVWNNLDNDKITDEGFRHLIRTQIKIAKDNGYEY